MSTNAEMTPAPVSEGARRATVDAGAHGSVGALDPEVTERAKRLSLRPSTRCASCAKPTPAAGSYAVPNSLTKESMTLQRFVLCSHPGWGMR